MSYGLTPAVETRRLPNTLDAVGAVAAAPLVYAALHPMRAAASQSVRPLVGPLTLVNNVATPVFGANPNRVSALIQVRGGPVVVGGSDLLANLLATGLPVQDGEILTLKTTGEIRVLSRHAFGPPPAVTITGIELVANTKQQ